MAKKKVVLRILVRSSNDGGHTGVSFIKGYLTDYESPRSTKEYRSPTRASLARIHEMYLEGKLSVSGTGMTPDCIAFLLRPIGR